MAERKSPTGLADETPVSGESFLSRFHRRKTEARAAQRDSGAAPEAHKAADIAAHVASSDTPDTADAVPEPVLTDADMPPLESLEFSSDFSGFLSPEVSEKLRRAALRKLFHSSELNIVDGLDEYAEDYTTFEPLGDIITSDMRHLIEVEARKKAEALKRALLDEQPDEASDEKSVEAADPALPESSVNAAAEQATTAAAPPNHPVTDSPGTTEEIAAESTAIDRQGPLSHARQ